MWLRLALILLTIYGLLAVFLTYRVLKGFDRWLDRPPPSGAVRKRDAFAGHVVRPANALVRSRCF
jgi:hypothetical protein